MLMAPDFCDRVTAKILLMTLPYSESSAELKPRLPSPSMNFLDCDVEMLLGGICIIQRVGPQ